MDDGKTLASSIADILYVDILDVITGEK